MKKLLMKDVINSALYNDLTAAERRSILKCEQAKEYSGLRRYPTTCERVFARIPNEWWGKYSAREIGEFAAMLKTAYDDGKNSPENA